jgi:pimeloyl-ACP methyl ester carboxylesterase
MSRTNIEGIGIDYELIGEGPLVAITPGGRFSKDTPGIRQLAERLAADGRTVMIWDRPNCGASDLCFAGETESVLNADTLAGLIRAVGRGPALLVGGSAGSRVSLIAASRHPDTVSGLFLLWISGGAIGLATLTVHYCGESAIAAVTGGMEAVAALPGWKEQLERNPGNRARLLALDPKIFVETMQRWGAAFFPQPGSPVPGMSPVDFAALPMKVMVLRSSALDLFHTRETSEEVHRLIPGSHIAEPPWPDSEWNDRMAAAARGEGLFANWPALAPRIGAFAPV